MVKLLRAGLRRYLHSAVLWLAVAASAVAAVLCGLNARDFYLDDVYIMVVFFALAVLLSWLVGREHEEGLFRNKVIAGYTKGQIFLSELILGIGAALLLFLLFAVIFAALNAYVLQKASAWVCVRIFLDVLLANVCTAAVLVAVACLIPKRALVAIVNILLVLGISFGAYGAENLLAQEEFYTEWDYHDQTFSDESGTYVVSVPIEGSEHPVENPRYVGGAARTALELAYDLLPYGHITEQIQITTDWFGYAYYDRFPDSGESWTSDKNLSISAQDSRQINRNLIYGALSTAVVCAAGYACFRKKELK